MSNGVWCFDSNPNTARILANSAFDWVCFDAQHGTLDRSRLADIARSLEGAPADIAVRVPANDPAWIGFALDAGASTVIVPLIESAEQARAAVQAAKYPPLGRRSWGQLAPIWGGSVVDPVSANASTGCWPMIESDVGLANVAAIAAVDGLDLLFVGPFDLALSLGTTVDRLLADEGAESPLARIAAAAAQNNVALGAFAGDPGRARAFRERGFSEIVLATDQSLLAAGLRATLG